ncbi:XRE family transcriptional regulator [Methanocaldococcus villosus KIN24-T80]|uniref:XRE family transcriptional regulator n=1 Tax=Methanocaldococcus villosus KIN24-T80 TaxID=1069083 RepID=N6W070_9EURY|nr:helix-turn-helix domain-containing protein [Methanocaldococcus villosus]ENN96757.1 XRE family transcriptional regulator [Methanocaldococcus villosus KIN24-T80]
MFKKLEIIERAILLNPRYIQSFRKKLKITQSRLAKESGISQSHLSMLEKGKREASELIAAAITYGLLKCFSEKSKNPIIELLDTLSLLKFEDAFAELVNNIIKENDIKYIRNIDGFPVIIIDKDSLINEMKKRLKVINLEKIEISRGKIKAFGKHIDSYVDIILDCSDIRRLEKKCSEKTKKNIIIQSFPKEEVPPIYGVKRDCVIIHCW